MNPDILSTVADVDDWHGLYRGDTSRDDVLFTPKSIQHPAKMSLPLLARIFDEMQSRGWLKTGDCVVDPFGGRFSTGLAWCARHPANRSVGIELEGHFVQMGQECQAHAEERLGRALQLLVLRGDSRQADRILAGDMSSARELVARERLELWHQWQHDWSARGIQPFDWYARAVDRAWVLEEWPDLWGTATGSAITSPPYLNSPSGSDGIQDEESRRRRGAGVFRRENYGIAPGQIGSLPDPVAVTSPPYDGQVSQGTDRHPERMPGMRQMRQYGEVSAVTSPPYGQTEVIHVGRSIGDAWREQGEAAIPAENGNKRTRRYGFTPGQIGQCPDPAEAVCVTSPPYGRGTIGKVDLEKLRALTQDPTSSLYGRDPDGPWFQAMAAGYINSPGNIDLCPDAAVTSPPYEGSLASDDPDKRGGLFRDPKRRNDRTLTGTYQAGVTSPPYENSINDRNGVDVEKCEKAGKRSQARLKGYAHSAVTSPPYEAQSGGHGGRGGHLTEALHARHAASNTALGYAENTDGQIGATQGETYADACLAVYSALARAGVRYLATVTKNPTREGQLRRLDLLTAELLQRAGYRIVAYRRAWLYETAGQAQERMGQASLFDDVPASTRLVGRVSFFKRIHLAKGAVAAQYEDILFAELVPLELEPEPEAAPEPETPAPLVLPRDAAGRWQLYWRLNARQKTLTEPERAAYVALCAWVDQERRA